MEKTQQSEIQNKDATQPIKILIADDDPPTRILLKAAISQWGLEIIEASDGEEAWDILRQPNPPTLLILDWLMPKIDGINLCERAKKELTNPPYIILLTQVTGTTNIVKGLEAGADEFLSKPFNMAELRSRLFVGVRIIKYQDAIKKQHAKFANYVSKVEATIQTALKTSSEISNYLENGDLLTNEEDFKKIETLNYSLKELIKILQGL